MKSVTMNMDVYRMRVGFAQRHKCHICLHQVLPSERSGILFLHGRFSVELGWCETVL